MAARVPLPRGRSITDASTLALAGPGKSSQSQPPIAASASSLSPPALDDHRQDDDHTLENRLVLGLYVP